MRWSRDTSPIVRPRGPYLAKLFMVQQPIQNCLKRVLNAVAASTQLAGAALELSPGRPVARTPVSLQGLHDEALSLNLEFVSGSVGWSVIATYMRLLSSFDGPGPGHVF